MSIQWNPAWRAYEKDTFIYRHCCSKFLYIYIYIYICGTTIPVPLSPVPVPLVQKGAVGIRYRYCTYWYRYRWADFGQIRVFNPFCAPLFIPLLTHHYIRQTLALLTSQTRKSKIACSFQCFHCSDPDSSQFAVQTW